MHLNQPGEVAAQYFFGGNMASQQDSLRNPSCWEVVYSLAQADDKFINRRTWSGSIFLAAGSGCAQVRCTFGEILDHAHLASARALAITVPDHDGARAILRLARARAPHVPIVVRARYHRFAREFIEAGATRVFDEESMAGQTMAHLVTECARVCSVDAEG